MKRAERRTCRRSYGIMKKGWVDDHPLEKGGEGVDGRDQERGGKKGGGRGALLLGEGREVDVARGGPWRRGGGFPVLSLCAGVGDTR